MINESSFEVAVKEHSRDLYRYAYWLSRDQHEAEDLVQQCFLKALRHWKSLRDHAATKKWLMTILRREFLRRLKSEKHMEPLPDMDTIPCQKPFLEDLVALNQALHEAPISLRDPLLLQVIGGFSCAEIAELQNTTAGAVMTKLTRSRQWLRKFLSVEQRSEEVTR